MGKETGIAKQVMEAPGYRLFSEARTTKAFTERIRIERSSGLSEVVKAKPTSAKNLFVIPSVDWLTLGEYTITHISGLRVPGTWATIRGAEVAASVFGTLFPVLSRKQKKFDTLKEEFKTMPDEIKNWIRGREGVDG